MQTPNKNEDAVVDPNARSLLFKRRFISAEAEENGDMKFKPRKRRNPADPLSYHEVHVEEDAVIFDDHPSDSDGDQENVWYRRWTKCAENNNTTSRKFYVKVRAKIHLVVKNTTVYRYAVIEFPSKYRAQLESAMWYFNVVDNLNFGKKHDEEWVLMNMPETIKGWRTLPNDETVSYVVC